MGGSEDLVYPHVQVTPVGLKPENITVSRYSGPDNQMLRNCISDAAQHVFEVSA